MIATRTLSPPSCTTCRVCGPAAAETSLDRAIHLAGKRDAVRHTQLGEHVPEVGVHGVWRDVQLPGHRTVRQSLGHEERHCPLGRSEALPAALGAVPRASPPGTDTEGPQLRTDPARPGLGARPLVAL